MKIKILSLLCIVFIILNFLYRTFGSILPWLYIRWFGRGAGVVFSLLSILTFLIFFWILSREFALQSHLLLKKAALWPVLGCIFALITEIRHILYHFTLVDFPRILKNPYWDIIAPLLLAGSILYFLFQFQKTVKDRIIRLEKAAQAGIIGFLLAAAIYFFITINFFIGGILPPFYQIGRMTGFFFLPIKIISTVFIISFFFQISKNEDKIAYIQEL